MMQGKTQTTSIAVALLVGGVALTGCGGKSPGSRAATVAGSSPAGTTGTASGPVTASSPAGSPSTPAPAVASSASSSPTGSGGPVLIVRTAAGDVSFQGRRPVEIAFSGDSSNVVTKLTWSSWAPTAAVGHGMWGQDNCQPNCARGTVTQVPATIRLSDVVDGHFTVITEQAQGLDRTYRYPSPWATGASTS
jgi:hypothetical protein